MKKFAIIFLLLFSITGFAQQKAEPFNNVDTYLFKTHQHFLLENNPKYAFMIIGMEEYDMGVSLSESGDSLILRYYSAPILHWLAEYNKARENGDNLQGPEYTEYILKLDSLSVFSRIRYILESIVDNAKPLKNIIPILDGVDWYVLAKGKWATIHTGGFHNQGEITELLESIATACMHNDPSVLSLVSSLLE